MTCALGRNSKDRRPPIASPPLALIPPRLEEFATARHLRVGRVLDLDPRRADTVRLVPAVAPFTNDALEITRACNLKQSRTSLWQVFNGQQTRRAARHDRTQATLAFMQRPRAKILAIDRQHIEGEVEGPVAPKQQWIKRAATLGIQTHDLAVENGTHRADTVRELFAEHVGIG